MARRFEQRHVSALCLHGQTPIKFENGALASQQLRPLHFIRRDGVVHRTSL